MITALGAAWLLDGLEGSLGGSLAGALKRADALGLTDAQLGLSSSLYLAGAVVGALLFGYLTDRYGRRRLFSWTLVLYLCSTAATGLAWNLRSFTFFRVLTGAGIGGEYAAINSAIDELVPARLRGRIDLWVNATFWIGIMLGSCVSSALLSARIFGSRMGWRFAFCAGLPLAAIVLWLRRFVPESPRWLLSRGALGEAQTVLNTIEASVRRQFGELPPVERSIPLPAPPPRRLRHIAGLLTGAYRDRSLLCLALMAAQAFFYNSVFFSLGLVLLRFYGASTARVGLCFIPIAIANFMGPVLLGPLVDSLGRRKLIAATYCLSGVVLLASSLLFYQGRLSLFTQVAWWAGAFFFASTAASSAYLSVSELFPQEVRASCIALFYAFGTLAGGVSGPLVFGRLMSSSARTPLLVGYAAGAAVMIAAGLAQAVWGVAAEGQSLESLTLDPGTRARARQDKSRSEPRFEVR